MGDWMWWILTSCISMYAVMLLLNFNKPSAKLMELIDSQTQRQREMEQRKTKLQEEILLTKSRAEDLELQLSELDERRMSLLPEANVRSMQLIDAGPFTMGSTQEDTPDNQRPAHTVQLSAFYMDPYPVTNQNYHEFVTCEGRMAPIHWQGGQFAPGTARHPVVNVSWQDAMAYATWRGARLPTEAEWEKAARGKDERLYPWGNRFVDGERCNNGNVVGTTLPVDEFPLGRSPYGIWDMSGNVSEWCHDYFEETFYQFSPSTNPKGPDGGQERVTRGGFFGDNRPGVRTTQRTGAQEGQTRDTIGFRVAMSVE